MAKLIYKPIGIICGIIAGKLATRLYAVIWSRIDSEEPPKASHEQASLGKVMGAAALEAVVFQTTRVAVDRAGARGFANLTGVWPGERAPEPAE
ncbi:MAG: DUF4235 domain-containing protein [Solirubrobacteraceae bacterium]